MLSFPMKKKDTVQFHLRPLRDLVNRLEDLSKRFKRESANQIAVEILRDYAELWAAAEQTKQEVIVRQTEAVTKVIREEALRGTLIPATTEQKITRRKIR